MPSKLSQEALDKLFDIGRNMSLPRMDPSEADIEQLVAIVRDQPKLVFAVLGAVDASMSAMAAKDSFGQMASKLSLGLAFMDLTKASPSYVQLALRHAAFTARALGVDPQPVVDKWNKEHPGEAPVSIS